jgi:hypothetical protein
LYKIRSKLIEQTGSRFYGSLSITQAFSTVSNGFHIAHFVIPQTGYHADSSAGARFTTLKSEREAGAVRWAPAAPQSLEREYDLPRLPPEQVLVAAEPIKRESGQLGKAEEVIADFRDITVACVCRNEIVLLGLRQLQLFPIRAAREFDMEPG